MDVSTRWLIRRDYPEVQAIESVSFEFPWFANDFLRYLRQRNCNGMVAVHDDRTVGYMVYMLHKTRIELVNFAVAPEVRRHGVGTQMAARLATKLRPGLRTRIEIEVRETNLVAQCFFRAVGYRAVSVVADHYDDTPEDAYRMRYRMAAEPKEVTCSDG